MRYAKHFKRLFYIAKNNLFDLLQLYKIKIPAFVYMLRYGGLKIAA